MNNRKKPLVAKKKIIINIDHRMIDFIEE